MLHRPASPAGLSVAALGGPGDATLPRTTLASLHDPFGTLDHESWQGFMSACVGGMTRTERSP